jgi:membrane-associated phospholipid phosphatase
LVLLEVATMRRWEWYDAFVAERLAALRACDPSRLTDSLSQWEAFLGCTMVGTAAIVGWRRGLAWRRVLRTVLWFGIGLVLLQGLKLVIARVRPDAGPWATGGASFPSGHVANATLAVAAAVALVRATRRRPDKTLWILGFAGGLFVLATAWTRVYLGRHWLTDVLASVLLALAFWNSAGPRSEGAPSWRRLAAAGTCGAVLLLVAERGPRLHLPSPATLGDATDSASAPRRRIRFEAPRGGRVVVKAVLSSRASKSHPTCEWVKLFSDGRLSGARPILPGWHTMVFALPAMRPGRHTVRLSGSGGWCHPAAPSLAVAALEVSGAGSTNRIAPRAVVASTPYAR